ncbi:thiopeptide-type bacteriocin biosynthesis protein [Nonomuraea thailandensis]
MVAVGAAEGKDHAAFRSVRRDAIRLIDPDGDWAGLAARPGGVQLLEIWRERRPALAAYGDAIRKAAAADRLSGTLFTVVSGLLHMHHNRLSGIKPAAESRTMAILRGTVEADLGRKRFMA